MEIIEKKTLLYRTYDGKEYASADQAYNALSEVYSKDIASLASRLDAFKSTINISQLQESVKILAAIENDLLAIDALRKLNK